MNLSGTAASTTFPKGYRCQNELMNFYAQNANLKNRNYSLNADGN